SDSAHERYLRARERGELSTHEALAIYRQELERLTVEAAPPAPELEVIRASEVEIRPLVWLWPGRIPAGCLVMLDGDPDQGKSHIALALAARITTGREMPREVPTRREPRDVVIVAAEDSAAETVCPRLIAAGADCDRIHLVKTHVS